MRPPVHILTKVPASMAIAAESNRAMARQTMVARTSAQPQTQPQPQPAHDPVVVPQWERLPKEEFLEEKKVDVPKPPHSLQLLSSRRRRSRSRLLTRLRQHGVDPDDLDSMAAFKPTPASIKTLLDKSETGSREEGFAGVRMELPVRMANIMKELQLMEAKVFGAHPVFARTLDDYADTFAELFRFTKGPVTDTAAVDYGDALRGIRERHFNAVERMAAITSDVVRAHGLTPAVDLRMQYFLSRFYMSRLSTKTLLSQYLDVFCNDMPVVGPAERLQVGVISRNIDVACMVEHSYQEARKMARAVYGRAPEINITTRNDRQKNSSNSQVIFDYLPSQLEYMLFEATKNALRAQIDAHLSGRRRQLRPIRAEVARENGFVHVSIEDDGEGVTEEKRERLFKYSYIPPSEKKEGVPARLGGQGYGVAHSRVYARYLQGEMFFESTPGTGSCVTFSLREDPAEASECLPVFNSSAQKCYNSPEEVSSLDWSAPKKCVQPLKDERQPAAFR